MYEINLTEDEKLSLESRHKKCRDSIESDRIKAILLRSESWSTSDIAQALRIHESTVTRHVKEYISNQKVRFFKGGSNSLLSEEQRQELIEHLSNNLYHHTHQIVEYIKQRWDIEYSVPGLNKWLKRNGFSYKKPKGRPHKADPAQQAAFIEKYENLKASLKPSETVLFMDSVHPTQATKLSYGWIQTGETLEISTTASRTRINLIGAVAIDNIQDAVIADHQTINAEAVKSFLGKLREKYPFENKLHIILDQAGYHRSEDFRLEAKKLNIDLHYLPPYSPNLNAIERLWKVMNEHVRNNQFFGSPKEFRDKIASFFSETLPKIGAGLRNRINDNFQRLKPAH